MLSLNFNAEQTNSRLKKIRFATLKKYIYENDLDVVFVQESWSFGKFNNLATELAGEMNMDVISHFEDGVTGILVTSTSIIAKKGLKLRNARYYKMPHSAPTWGDGHNFWIGFGGVNMLIGANITLPTGEMASLWSTHLSTVSSQDRIDQVQFAIQKMKALADFSSLDWRDTLTIIAGDFNAGPNSREMNSLRGAEFVDLWQASHPFDPGHTLVGDVDDPEYNPVVHGPGQFPSQAGPEETNRIDYIYAHIPKPFFTSLGRVFTAPAQVDGETGWMSDHFGLRGEIDLAGEIPEALPSADSDFSKLPPTQMVEITRQNAAKWPPRVDFTASAERGLTVMNSASARVEFDFQKKLKGVYTKPGGTASSGEMMSFLFFEPGDYPYKMKIHLADGFATEIVTEGVVHVYNASKNSN